MRIRDRNHARPAMTGARDYAAPASLRWGHARADQGLLRRHPRRGHRQQAVAAVPGRRAEVPARPDRIRAVAAARHLGPARAAHRAGPDRGRHGARAPRGRGGPAARHRRPERDPGVRAARVRGRDRARRGDPAPPGSGRHHRILQRRPRHPRHPRVRVRGARRRRGRPPAATSSRSGSRRPSPPSASATSSRARSWSSRAPGRPPWWSGSWRSPTSPPRRATWPTAATCGTRGCSSPGPTCCWTSSSCTSRRCTPG